MAVRVWERQLKAENKGWPGHPVHLLTLPRAGLRCTYPPPIERLPRRCGGFISNVPFLP